MNPLMSSIVYINGIDTANQGIYPIGRVPVPTPEQDIEHIEIKGRNGSLTKKYGYKDIPYPLEFYITEKSSFKQAFRLAKLFLLQAKTLSFSDDSDVHYRVKSIRIDTAENIILKYGRFVVEFTLAPFQYENNPIQTITSRTTLTNPGYESDPVITVHCAGTGKLYVNNVPITIQNINGTIIIDSELMNAYRNSSGIITNLNNHMIGDFPVLKHGSNVIEFDGDITKLEVNPRWRWV